jgi:fumarate reductase flavoprotein subunit
MSHLGPDSVRRQFKGMVDRCADCGFDLAGDKVEVVPTAHYMMGGLIFDKNCRTELPGLFAAGEDTGGVHGANRLGGNGVANSTVFGGIAGDVMGAWVPQEGTLSEPDAAAIDEAIAGCERPFGRPAGSVHRLRETLYDLMWDDVGIMREAPRLQRAQRHLAELQAQLRETRLSDSHRGFNLAWHDWLNLDSLITVSRAITAAALAREDSRGAHYREDFPEAGDMNESAYTVVRKADDSFPITTQPVSFARVRPGETLIRD